MRRKLIDFLSEHMTQERREQFERVLRNRTRYITVVLEDIYQSHNASAVLRSCDCFGIQDVHIVENRNRFQVNPDVALGSANWLTIKKYNQNDYNTIDALSYLKNQGYRIVATSPEGNSTNLTDFDLTKGKTALVFGTEKDGLTPEVYKFVDESLRIPMFGFTQSFNISVSVALILFELTKRMREQEIRHYLTDEEMEVILLDWVRTSIKKSKLIENEFYKRNSS